MPLQAHDKSTFEYLDSLLNILGSTRVVLLPFLTAVGQVVQSYGGSAHTFTPRDEATALNLEDEFIPYKHKGGVFSYFNDRSVNNHLDAPDSADFEGGSGTDAAFSVGAWVMPHVAGTEQAILAKYDVAGNLREYKLTLDSSEIPTFELFDESIADAAAAVQAPATAAVTINEWSSIIATYNGAGGNPGFAGSSMTFVMYTNGAADTGTVAGTGDDDYVDMEDTGTLPTIGCADDSAAPTIEFEGRIALPFWCGKELSAIEASRIHEIGRRLIGV